ncbi:MAG: hypothetical protein R2932_47685 [Caldilineaceae bacterium]
MSHKQKHFRFFFTILLLALEAWLAVMLYRGLRAYGVRLPDRESALLRAFTVARLQTAIPTSGLVPDPVAPSPTATVTPTATPLPPTQTAQPTATRDPLTPLPPSTLTLVVIPLPTVTATSGSTGSGSTGRMAQQAAALGDAPSVTAPLLVTRPATVAVHAAVTTTATLVDTPRPALAAAGPTTSAPPAQPSPTWTVVYVLPTPAAVDLFDAATRVARVTLAATTTGTATPLPPNWRVYTIRIVPYEPPPANHATATMLALAATARAVTTGEPPVGILLWTATPRPTNTPTPTQPSTPTAPPSATATTAPTAFVVTCNLYPGECARRGHARRPVDTRCHDDRHGDPAAAQRGHRHRHPASTRGHQHADRGQCGHRRRAGGRGDGHRLYHRHPRPQPLYHGHAHARAAGRRRAHPDAHTDCLCPQRADGHANPRQHPHLPNRTGRQDPLPW